MNFIQLNQEMQTYFSQRKKSGFFVGFKCLRIRFPLNINLDTYYIEYNTCFIYLFLKIQLIYNYFKFKNNII